MRDSRQRHMEPVPSSVFEAAVRVAGRALHWKHSRLMNGSRESGFDLLQQLPPDHV